MLVQEEDELIHELNQIKTLTDDEIKATMQFRQDAIQGMQNPTFDDKRRVTNLLPTNLTVQDQAKSCLMPGVDPTAIEEAQL